MMTRFVVGCAFLVLASGMATGERVVEVVEAPGEHRGAPASPAEQTAVVEERLSAMWRGMKTLLSEGQVGAARASFEEQRALAARERLDDRALGSRIYGAWIEVEDGDLAAGAAHVDAVLSALPGAQIPEERREHLRAAALTMRVRILAAKREFAAARALASAVRASAEKRDVPAEINVLEAVLGWTEGEAGRFAAALEHLAKAPQEFAVTRFYEAQVREKAGDAARAAQLYAELASSTEDDFFHALVRARAARRGAEARVR